MGERRESGPLCFCSSEAGRVFHACVIDGILETLLSREATPNGGQLTANGGEDWLGS